MHGIRRCRSCRRQASSAGHNGFFAPQGLPAGIKTSLESACAYAVKRPTVQRALENAGQTLHYLTSEQFRALITADYKFKGELIHRLGLAAQ